MFTGRDLRSYESRVLFGVNFELGSTNWGRGKVVKTTYTVTCFGDFYPRWDLQHKTKVNDDDLPTLNSEQKKWTVRIVRVLLKSI